MLWAKGKTNDIALSVALLQGTGALLLDLTSFPMVYSDLCKDCKHDISKLSSSDDVCPVTKRAHPIGTDTVQETQQNIAKIASTMRAAFSVCLGRLQRSLSTIPRATFRHGMYWYKVQRQVGFMALLRFRLSDIRFRDTLVILRSTLSVRLGSGLHFRIVVAPDERSEDIFHSFTGMVATATFSYAKSQVSYGGSVQS